MNKEQSDELLQGVRVMCFLFRVHLLARARVAAIEVGVVVVCDVMSVCR
jgi:hypothetical protein